MDGPEWVAGAIVSQDAMENQVITTDQANSELTFDVPRRTDVDNLNRVVKIAVDAGEVASFDAAYELFKSYRLCVVIGPELRVSATHQAALLTIVNAGRRALLGGVVVVGDVDCPLVVPIPGCDGLSDAIERLGGIRVAEIPENVPTLIVGSPKNFPAKHPVTLQVMFSDWRGGVVPRSEEHPIDNSEAIVPAAILAAALGVSEAFQHLRGNPMAGRRSAGMSLWSPACSDWQQAPAGPISIVLPSRLWLLGLGHLGQAYLWTLGLLPYQRPGDVELIFQDFDRLTLANDSTSLLTTSQLVGQPKTRAMADWAERRGFRIRIVERRFPGGVKIAADEPRLALGGVDNLEARAAYEDAGFDCVVDAGLGAGPTEYLALRIHKFPASTSARAKWGDVQPAENASLTDATAYAKLAAEGMDACGLVQLATRTVGAPFVGATAACLVITEVLRCLNGGPRLEIVDMTLRDPSSRSVVESSRGQTNFNPGFTS